MGMTRQVLRKRERRRMIWKVQPERVIAPYPKRRGLVDAVPEYGGARGTLSESGSTTIQA